MKDFSYDEVKPWNDATEVIVENGVTGIGEVDFYIGLMQYSIIKIPVTRDEDTCKPDNSKGGISA